MDENRRDFLRSLGQVAGAGAVAAVLPGCLASRFIFTPRISVRTGKLQISDGYTHYLTVKSQKEGETDIAEIVMTDEPHNEESWMHIRVPGYEKELWAETGVEQQEGTVLPDFIYMLHVLDEVEKRIGGKKADITKYHIHPFSIITKNYQQNMMGLIKGIEDMFGPYMPQGINHEVYLDQEKFEFMALPSAQDFSSYGLMKKMITDRGHHVGPERIICAPGMFEFAPSAELEALCQSDHSKARQIFQNIEQASTLAGFGIDLAQTMHELEYAETQNDIVSAGKITKRFIEKMAGPVDLEAAMAVMAANGAHVKYYRQREILTPQKLTF